MTKSPLFFKFLQEHIGLLAVFIIGGLVIMGAFCFRADAFWITDGGNKYMVGRTLLEQGTLTLSMNEDNKFFPIGGFHFIPQGDGFRSVFPDYYAVVTAPFGALWGMRGLLLLQWFSLIGLLGMFFIWCRHWGWSFWSIVWSMLALTFATPIAFYSWTYWEMVPSVAWMMGVIYLISCRRLAWWKIGVLLGLGLWIRAEFYFMVVALVVTQFSFRDYKKAIQLLCGFVAGGVLIWLYQYNEYGHILGLHGATYHQHNSENIALGVRFQQQLQNYYYYIVAFSGQLVKVLWIVLALSFGVGAWAKGFMELRKIKIAFAIVGAIVWHFLASEYWGAKEPVLQTIFMVGVVSALPFLQIVLLNWRGLFWGKNREIMFWARLLIFYTLLVPPLLTANDLGIIWGARHWMILLPVMIFVCGYAVWRMRAIWIFLLLGFVALELQIGGWRGLSIMTENSAKLSQVISEKSGDVVISDLYFLPEQTPKLYFEKRWLYLDTDAKLKEFLATPNQPSRLELVVSKATRYRKLSNQALRALMQRYKIVAAPTVVELSGTAFLEVVIFNLEIR